MFVKCEIFGQEADLLFSPHISRRKAKHTDLSGVGEKEPHDDADAGGFPRAVRAEEGAHLAGLDLERNIRQRAEPLLAEPMAEDLGYIPELNDWRRRFVLRIAEYSV
jgi:hypothetical protein